MDKKYEVEWLRAELESARKAVFMPSQYPGTLTEYLSAEVWPTPRTEDVEEIAKLRVENAELRRQVEGLTAERDEAIRYERTTNELRTIALQQRDEAQAELATLRQQLKRLAEILLPEIETERDWLDAGHDIEIGLHYVEAKEVLELLK